MIKKKFNPLKSSWSSKFYKFCIKERQNDIKYLKEEIKIYTTWYKAKLKQEKSL